MRLSDRQRAVRDAVAAAQAESGADVPWDDIKKRADGARLGSTVECLVSGGALLQIRYGNSFRYRVP